MNTKELEEKYNIEPVTSKSTAKEIDDHERLIRQARKKRGTSG